MPRPRLDTWQLEERAGEIKAVADDVVGAIHSMPTTYHPRSTMLSRASGKESTMHWKRNGRFPFLAEYVFLRTEPGYVQYIGLSPS